MSEQIEKVEQSEKVEHPKKNKQVDKLQTDFITDFKNNIKKKQKEIVELMESFRK